MTTAVFDKPCARFIAVLVESHGVPAGGKLYYHYILAANKHAYIAMKRAFHDHFVGLHVYDVENPGSAKLIRSIRVLVIHIPT
jgi:hypothetical protein